MILQERSADYSLEKSLQGFFQIEMSFHEKDIVYNEFRQYCKNVTFDDILKIQFIHSTLKEFYEQCFSININIKQRKNLGFLYEILHLFEEVMESMELQHIPNDELDLLLSLMPSSKKEFLVWYTDIIKSHPAYNHRFYSDFLRNKSSYNDIRYFLAQESTLDPRFDDILALIQVGAPLEAKLELASNYWDEMGNGDINNAHSLLFQKVLDYFKVSRDYIDQTLSLDAIVSGNLSSYLSLYRKNYYKAIGYFAVTEYLVPIRFRHFIKGCQGIGIPDDRMYYHKLHIPVDSRHAVGWIKNVLSEVAMRDQIAAKEIMLGTFYRLNSSKRYLDFLETMLTPIKASNSY